MIPVSVLLPLVFQGIGAVSTGYQFLESVKKANAEATLTPEHLMHLQRVDPQVHAIAVKANADWSIQQQEQTVLSGASESGGDEH
jgi:hypothetical protein